MVEDMHRDGVCYVETRFAPVFHTQKGLHWEEVVRAVLKGLERGEQDFGVKARLIIAPCEIWIVSTR
jgi:Adenosine deaminase